MPYFCVDCEASGPVPALFNLLSIGVCVVRPEAGRHVLGTSLYLELKPIFPGFDEEAMAVCGLDRARLLRDGIEAREAMERLGSFVAEANGPGDERPIFVGHNAVFDWSFIAYYYAHFGIANPFGYKGIDTKSLAMGVLGLPWRDTSKEKLEVLLGLPPQDPTRTHRADYDAMYQAGILKALLDRRA